LRARPDAPPELADWPNVVVSKAVQSHQIGPVTGMGTGVCARANVAESGELYHDETLCLNLLIERTF